MSKRKANPDVMVDASIKDMRRMWGYSENRIRVALQNGGLRTAFAKMDEKGITVKKQAAIYLNIVKAMKQIGTIDEATINEICRKWDAEGAKESA